jgi:penicillin amidase
VYNPPSGIIASANQDPFPENYRYAVNGGFAPPYRAREIRTLLSAREKWKPEDMLGVQKDVYSD